MLAKDTRGSACACKGTEEKRRRTQKLHRRGWVWRGDASRSIQRFLRRGRERCTPSEHDPMYRMAIESSKRVRAGIGIPRIKTASYCNFNPSLGYSCTARIRGSSSNSVTSAVATVQLSEVCSLPPPLPSPQEKDKIRQTRRPGRPFFSTPSMHFV